MCLSSDSKHIIKKTIVIAVTFSNPRRPWTACHLEAAWATLIRNRRVIVPSNCWHNWHSVCVCVRVWGCDCLCICAASNWKDNSSRLYASEKTAAIYEGDKSKMDFFFCIDCQTSLITIIVGHNFQKKIRPHSRKDILRYSSYRIQ